MKKSELKAIIKEEIAKMYGSDDAIQKELKELLDSHPQHQVKVMFLDYH